MTYRNREYPTNADDILDSRDVIRRLRELEKDEGETVAVRCGACGGHRTVEPIEDHDEPASGEFDACPTCGGEGTIDEPLLDYDDTREELNTLRALDEEGRSASSEWADGATLVRDSYFEDFARQEAEDLGLISSDTQWPATCIDWERAARELQMDYTSIDYDGVTYWVRS